MTGCVSASLSSSAGATLSLANMRALIRALGSPLPFHHLICVLISDVISVSWLSAEVRLEHCQGSGHTSGAGRRGEGGATCPKSTLLMCSEGRGLVY